MDILSMLDKLQSQVEDVITYSQGFSKNNINCHDIIDAWWNNKSKFFPILGKNLIWESPHPISIDYSTEMKESMFDQFVVSAADYLDRCGEDEDNYCTWEDWIRDNRDGFFKNVVINAMPDTEMKVGMKLIKAFKFFNLSDSSVRYIQDLASQIIQKTKIEGTLCVSIHPLDYLSISENNMNWRSCHALDGEYRAGNLSYMVDPSTIVCYIRSHVDVQLRRFPDGLLWNNKKWRVLLHVGSSFNIAYVNRQYPFSCDDLIKELQVTNPMIIMGFSDPAGYVKDAGFCNIKSYGLSQNYFVYKGLVLDPRVVCGGDERSLQYNDFIHSPHYTPQFIKTNRRYFFDMTTEQANSDLKAEIGKRVPCPCGCGNFLTDSDCMICDYCRDQLNGVIGYCEECGEPIYEDDLFGVSIEDTSRIYCRSCSYGREGVTI